MKTVLFLGAGFSRAWGLPVMQEFFQYAKDSEYLKYDDKDFLRKLQVKAREGVSMLQMRHDNLEEILSFSLASESFSAGYPNQSNREYEKLCYILGEVYRSIGFKEYKGFRGSPLLGNLKELLGIGQEKLSADNLFIITTNYDVMIEFCLSGLGLHCYLPFEWDVVDENRQYADHMYSRKKSGLLLCKLHGSLNWFCHAKDTTKLLIESGINRGEYDDDDLDDNFRLTTRSYPEISLEGYRSVSVPLIIPPTLFKMQTDALFREIWNAAGKTLKEADELVFVGFSFPASDTYIRYFLAANIYENIDLRTITIIDPKADEICEKLKKSNFGIHFRNLLKPINGKWEDIDYSVI